ncbi:MAG: ferritin-like protein [Flavobacteriales bacterium]|nr:ferritin-like protein [Flavobacteriales bacterium]
MSTTTAKEESFQQQVSNAKTLEELLIHSKKVGVDKEDQLMVLKELLHQAVALEFATIPIYLSAMWAIKDNNCEVAKSIRNIFQEEMLHMSMVCNMLVGIGGQPKIYTAENRLSYPSGLPGDVHPHLFLYLEGFNDCSLRNFMEIELPDEIADIYDYDTGEKDGLDELCGIHDHQPGKNSNEHFQNYNSTIGEMYDQINALFHVLQPDMNVERQLSGPLAWFVMADADSVSKAIKFIKEQGEGSENVTPASTGMDNLAHFYRFWEIYYKKKIVEEKGKFFFKDPYPRPESYKIARIPKGGYLEGNVSAETWFLLHEFDKTYSELVMLLEDAWTEGGGGQASLIKGIDVMFQLEKYALPLMNTPIPKNQSGEHYGPCFRIIDLD